MTCGGATDAVPQLNMRRPRAAGHVRLMIAGLFKSTDGGSSWIRLGSGYPSSAPSNANIFFNQVINVVIVDPANNQIVYVASNFGLFVSNDGGLNWVQGELGSSSMYFSVVPKVPIVSTSKN